jgi:oxygen-independent coproporphyrinogen-3 oxidase
MSSSPASTVAVPAAGTRLALASLPPLALYVHLPWCVRKCPYCDFNSHEWRGGGALPEDDYVSALVADLESALPLVWGRRVQTVFLGGGTPSLFSARALDTLLAAVRARLPLAADAEITLEANPGTFEMEKFRDYRAAGINRLSIGVQSFSPAHLRALGRIHDADEARRAVDAAATLFDNFNVDIMYALPGQTPDEAVVDIATAIASGVPHVSAYHLTLEPNTLFARHPPPLPDEDTASAIHDAVVARLDAAGFEHYETSAHARPGHRARHNVNYWRFGDYLGIGAGAHGKLSFPDRIVRQARHRQPREYMTRVAAGNAVQEERLLRRSELPFEFMLNALRLTEGFAVAEFTERTGLPIGACEPALGRAIERGLVERTLTHVRPTALGRRFLNDLLEMFLPDGSSEDDRVSSGSPAGRGTETR